MIGLWVVLGILILLAVILLIPITLQLDYDNTQNRTFWKISWFAFSLFSSDESGFFQRKESKSKVKKKKTDEEKDEKKESRLKKGKRIWKMVRDIVPILPKPFRILWKGISIRKLVIGVQVGRFDAKDCAVAYGTVSGTVYTTLGILQSLMRVQVEQVQVQCAFGKDQTLWIVRGKMYFCLLSAFAAIGSLAIGYVTKRNQNTVKPTERSTKKSKIQENTGG